MKTLRHTQSLKKWSNGLVVQLVRISACHAGGREFESRPDRIKSPHSEGFLLLQQYRKSKKALCWPRFTWYGFVVESDEKLFLFGKAFFVLGRFLYKTSVLDEN